MNNKPDSPAEILAQPDEVLFQRMGCHVFALELQAEFQRAGINGTEIHYLEFAGNDELAAHVVVKTPNGYYDSKFGPRTEEQIKQDFPKHNESKIVAVPNLGWLTVGSRRDPQRSWLVSIC